MKVQGVKIPEQVTNYAVRWMKAQADFSLTMLRAMLEGKFPKYREQADRTADRLIQNHKKSGDLEKAPKRRWKWVGTSEL